VWVLVVGVTAPLGLSWRPSATPIRPATMVQRNPTDPASFNHKIAHLSTGRMYHFVDEYDGKRFDPVKTPTLLCIHGVSRSPN
jgi:hypothetical protein